ncbi:Fis family transcriptional regulator [Intrasporangium calvum]|uniref:Fis family transcriptional regulator n=1 Tax=Intrasporangium calvum TaxID=53358 RepID=A0ABT5GDC3_9MICO|nr:GAF domain-containing protein [Intrasporangium calvum]MDC5696153.1 Fis family transcriptional regulator [Intrasporangium calvum]
MTGSDESRLPLRAGAEYPGPDGPVSRRVLASWQRSQDYGVPLEAVEPVWAGSIVSDSLFFECGREVLTGLHQTLANEPVALMLTDADGLVLNRFSGDTSLLRTLDRVHLAPGFAFSEREVGTNGLGLALADRTASLVRAEEHYSASLCTYTCAAVPVLDPHAGRLEGSINITTWANRSPDLLLALAQVAASNTSALMLARAAGARARPQARGGVFRVKSARLEPSSGSLEGASPSWSAALDAATHALLAGSVVAATGEPGAGRATLLGQALRRARPGYRIISAAAPAPEDVDAWLGLWTPELAKPHTAVIVENVDVLPSWAAQELRDRAARVLRSLPDVDGRPAALSWGVTASRLDEIPQPLVGLVDTVVPVAPLRERTDDILPLARLAGYQTRLREVGFTASAERALTSYGWPGNVDELMRVVHDAATQTELIDAHHLPAWLRASGRRLTRIETVERDEISRVLTLPGMTMKQAALDLGLSRATLYRKLSLYGLGPADR